MVLVIYEGPSELNGQPIVGIITGLTTPSLNAKTGPMAQLWIMAADEQPHKAVQSGRDKSVCGDCKFRPLNLGTCYVTTFQGPRSVYATWQRGGYQPFNKALLTGAAMRLGAYGDPAALPLYILEEITNNVDRYTGYTHQWKTASKQLSKFCMASVDDELEAEAAKIAGYRTFRVTTSPGDKGLSREVVCPASDEAGNKITCFECGACDGRRRPTVKSNIVIFAHGNRTKKFIKEYGI